LLKYFCIALGGALGSIARYWVGSTVSGRLGARFPYGTFAINMTACVLIGFVLFGQVVTQHAVLERQVADTAALHKDYAAIAGDLRRLGVTGRCLINGSQSIPVAFYADCASAPAPARAEPAQARMAGLGDHWRFSVLEWASSRPPAYARNWPRFRLNGAGYLKLTAYLPPAEATRTG